MEQGQQLYQLGLQLLMNSWWSTQSLEAVTYHLSCCPIPIEHPTHHALSPISPETRREIKTRQSIWQHHACTHIQDGTSTCASHIFRLYSWSHSPQFSHVGPHTQQHTNVNTKCPDIRACLTAHPKHTCKEMQLNQQGTICTHELALTCKQLVLVLYRYSDLETRGSLT